MHKKTLQNLFCYRKREEVLAEIQSSWKLNDLFISPFKPKHCYSFYLL